MAKEDTGKITFATGMKLPQVYGTYSSHEVSIGLTIPATREEVDNFEEVVEGYLERAMVYQRRVLNAVLTSLGKDEVFDIA